MRQQVLQNCQCPRDYFYIINMMPQTCITNTQYTYALPHCIYPNTPPASPLQETQICPPPLVPSTPSLLWGSCYRLEEVWRMWRHGQNNTHYNTQTTLIQTIMVQLDCGWKESLLPSLTGQQVMFLLLGIGEQKCFYFFINSFQTFFWLHIFILRIVFLD